MIKKSLMQDWLARPLACASKMILMVGVSSALMLGSSLKHDAEAATITLSVDTSNKDVNGVAVVENVSGFRYLVEEDTTIQPNVGVQNDYESLSFSFHRSHNPVAVGDDGAGISGSTNGLTATITVPDPESDANGEPIPKDYFISVVPFNGHALGGGSVTVSSSGNVDKTLRVNRFPIPTAQISIRVFEDNNPVNGAIDLDETGLSHSIVNGQRVPFSITLFDAAGQYGAAGGRVIADAYGNPLGTEYHPTATDADGIPVVVSTPADVNGFVLTPNDEGYIVIKHLPPAKYGVEIVPPPGLNGNPLWVQTSTIEGTRTIDAWVKANEPETFVEFGPPGPHVFVGFVRTFDCLADNFAPECLVQDPNGEPGTLIPAIDTSGGVGATIFGNIVNNHMARPPVFEFANGEFFEGCRVAVNLGIAGRTIYSQPCGNEAAFNIANLPAGAYSLSIWDDGLDAVIANHPFTVSGNDTSGYQVSALIQNPVTPGGGTTPVNICDPVDGCDMGHVPVFDWFHQLDTVVFYDQNENGTRDCVTDPCNDPTQDDVSLNADSSATNLRFRDGRIYKSVPIDVEGAAPHEEVFPFFHWLVAEVDFATYKATGATMIADDGGYDANLQDNGYVPQPQLTRPVLDVDGNLTYDASGNLITEAMPTCQNHPSGEGLVDSPCTWDGVSRTETGAVLTQAFQGFLGQKNVIEFGKTDYEPGENGGISGMAIYAITRAEDDPRFAAAEEWEPGIPRVQVALYKDANNDGSGIREDINGVAGFQEADVDNYPLGWSEGGVQGPEDFENSVDANGPGVWDKGDALEVTWTDSWDDSQPVNCGGENLLLDANDEELVPNNNCFDGLRNWNQIRPGVFDGGYAFSENLDSGYYIVQSFTPPGYTLLKEEDKNVDFGDEYAVPQLLPPTCVGDSRVVPALLSHVTDDNGVVQIVTGDPADYEAPYAGDSRPLCDRKSVRVGDGRNAAADFHYFTEVPKAAHVVGGVINDLANEFNPAAPTFGEKFAPPWVPVAFYDYQGHEIQRVYTDQFGKYNAMLPSTNTVNIASPSGMAPNMVTACMNDAGQIPNPSYDSDDPTSQPFIIDPNHNPQYSQFCYVFQYMPGGTTYLDTPVQQIAAFTGSGLQLDCEAGTETPMIRSVKGAGYVGPYIVDQNDPTEANRLLTIRSRGKQFVPNPSSDELTNKYIERDYGFGGTMGTVTLIQENGTGHNLVPDSWNDVEITGPVPTGIPDGRYQLVVTTAAGASSPMGVTVTVGDLPRNNATVHNVMPSTGSNATPIQDAIDAANIGDLILVAEGTYNELVIMWKPVYLQGAGAYATTINARSVPAEKVEAWQAKIIDELLLGPTGAQYSLIDGQELGELFVTEEGAGVTVVGLRAGNRTFNNGNRRSRIDGFKITGASTGGGVFVNGHINGLRVSNNLVSGNQGTYSGGVRLGHYAIQHEVLVGGGIQLEWPDARNSNIRIHHNMITQNGNFNGAGGGVSIYNGSTNYRITDNLICGNFAATDGAGIGHLGHSRNGRILDNQILFNQSFRQTPGFETDGGGILIAGNDGLNGSTLSDGSGRVFIDRNLIQGNQAGAGDGGGIALRKVNGVDISVAPATPGSWDRILIRNNTIVNNMAGYAGGGVSLKDAARVDMWNNTIVNNESTATAGAAFDLSPTQSTPQVAGIVSREYETLMNVLQFDNLNNRFNKPFPNPLLRNNAIWHNSSNHYELATNSLIDDGYRDLGVDQLPAGQMNPRYSLLSNKAGYNQGTNIDDFDPNFTLPVFANAYDNGNPSLNPTPGEFKTVQVAPALDEGGNWLDVRYAPLSINDVDGVDDLTETPSDYHQATGSILMNNGNGNRGGNPNLDIDLEGISAPVDIGSDEVQ